ncbi:antitoxin [Gordonia sp. CPCC 205515]|uniref:type II toxin-antitoxin system VapB family antitoxin n=1 Tax=Gordonia sp. CPCC 205515 TaxID=3140791 RepID=UPI003AF38C98
MNDVRISDVPDEVLAAIDTRAERLGLSRTDYLRRRILQDAAAESVTVTFDDLRRFTASHAGLADDELMATAWR